MAESRLPRHKIIRYPSAASAVATREQANIILHPIENAIAKMQRKKRAVHTKT